MTGSAYGVERTTRAWRPRRKDRRAALAQVIAALTGQVSGGATLRDVFEAAMRRVLPVRALQIRERGAAWTGASGTPLPFRSDAISFQVPGLNGAVLEAVFEPATPRGEWDVETMAGGAQLAALVLELERHRQERTRPPMSAGPRGRAASGAALIGSAPAMAILRDQIERVAATDFTVLLEGESGSGKELVARQIHERSRRRSGPFVAINCAALVETLLEAELFGIEERTATGVKGRRGKFEQADGGTLFLDEVSDLSPSSQAKVLRAIQELSVERVGGHGVHRVDIRIVAATNRPLSGLVERKAFRPDLFYRLSGVDLRVPPLRERSGDVLKLTEHFLERHRALRPLRLSPAAADALTAYDWPGNVRELERLIERVVALAASEAIELSDLPAPVRGDYDTVLGPSLRGNDSMRAWGSRYARLVLDRCGGNKREACRTLSISYHTLMAYLRYPARAAGSRTDAWDDPGSCVAGDGEVEPLGELGISEAQAVS